MCLILIFNTLIGMVQMSMDADSSEIHRLKRSPEPEANPHKSHHHKGGHHGGHGHKKFKHG